MVFLYVEFLFFKKLWELWNEIYYSDHLEVYCGHKIHLHHIVETLHLGEPLVLVSLLGTGGAPRALALQTAVASYLRSVFFRGADSFTQFADSQSRTQVAR